MEIATIVISLLALASSAYVGYRQVKVSEAQVRAQRAQAEAQKAQAEAQKAQVDAQNKVEIFLNVEVYNGMPAVLIRNIGNAVIYLEKYTFNGQEYPLGEYVLPPFSTYDWCWHIELPTNGASHVSLKVDFKDWSGKEWQTIGYANYGEGGWKIAYSPCKKSKGI